MSEKILAITEHRLLSSLVQNCGTVVSHNELHTEVWGRPYNSAAVLLSVQINYLRKKPEHGSHKPPVYPHQIVHWGLV